jgi:alginate O-acetyltransferase complex protein AlgI
MLFNSIQFLIFFPIVTALFFALPQRYRWHLLLAASCVFYMAFIPVYLLILVFTIIIDYIAGIMIESAAAKRRKLYLIISLLSNCGILAFFKYYNFVNDNLQHLAGFLNISYSIPALSILLPIGLSFHTFQAMSYTIEVYYGRQKAVRHFGIYALYVMFYPQLVAGPIERPQNLIHQFLEFHSFDYNRVTSGLKLMLWGMFKKVVIADRLAIYVDQIYDHPHDHSGLSFIIATVFFAFQIYCDFSGYSDIAIGAARVMGIELMTNFNRPYQARSISEFWTRWHISLSTWFRDYLYIPLGGNRVNKGRWYFNLFFTFLVSGIWHGASWTFVIWGALNGFYLLCSIWTEDFRAAFVRTIRLNRYPEIHHLIQVMITFSLTCLGWIFFRANNVSDAVYIITHLFDGVSGLFANVGKREIAISFLLIAFLESIQAMQSKRSISQMVLNMPVAFRWAIYYAILLSIMVFGEYGSRQFIYFQF